MTAQSLRPDGTPLAVDGVLLSTPGLTGQVEVLTAATSGLHSREGTAAGLVAGLAAAGFMEQLTVEISDPVEVPGPVGPIGSRAFGPADTQITVTVPSPGRSFAQVLLYTAEDGSQSWHLPAGPQGPGAPVGDGQLTYTIAREVRPVPTGPGPAYRGLVGMLGRKLLKVLVFALLERGTAIVAEHTAQRWEQQHRPYLLRAFTPDDYTRPGVGAVATDDWERFAAGPVLLFLHGTFSRSDLAFGGLPRERFTRLYEHYRGRVLAFDHPTLSADPVANVRELLARVPTGTSLTVDVIGHSRGGLVGRELCEAGVRPGVGVRRLVMVGTPNAGTILADSRHWAAYLDRMTNLLQFVPGNPVTDTLAAVLTVLKHLALGAVAGLDGLSAMDPAGPYLTRRLNRTRPPGTGPHPPAVLYAVASDYDPPVGSPLSRVSRNGVTDLVFGAAANDLVVPTAGVHRLYDVPGFPVPGPLLLDPGSAVDHSGYFGDPVVGEQVEGWLLRPGADCRSADAGQ